MKVCNKIVRTYRHRRVNIQFRSNNLMRVYSPLHMWKRRYHAQMVSNFNMVLINKISGNHYCEMRVYCRLRKMCPLRASVIMPAMPIILYSPRGKKDWLGPSKSQIARLSAAVEPSAGTFSHIRQEVLVLNFREEWPKKFRGFGHTSAERQHLQLVL